MLLEQLCAALSEKCALLVIRKISLSLSWKYICTASYTKQSGWSLNLNFLSMSVGTMI